jgi:hypothetical protein
MGKIERKKAQIKALRKQMLSHKCKNPIAVDAKIRKLQHEVIIAYKGKSYEQFLAQ